MLERVALHQTRLRTPGLLLDARGIAQGPRGLLLFPSYDRLVAFLAMYAERQVMDDLATSLRVELAKSALGTRELLVSFAIEGSERMDGVAEVARLAGAHVFTGGGRHWVAYRDAAAPFGYDVADIEGGDAPIVLYHPAFRQAFAIERAVDLRALLLRLRPTRDPSAGREPSPKWLLAEWGLGGAMLQYLRRSGVEGRVALAEWPPASDLEDEPIRRYLFELPSIPPRMIGLFQSTPGLCLLERVASGAAVEVGFRHPVRLGAFPAFRGPQLVLFRGTEAPLELTSPPAFGRIDAFARLEVGEGPGQPAPATKFPPSLRVPLRVLPTTRPSTAVVATLVPPAELPMLRRLLYVLGPETLRRSRFAVTDHGAFVIVEGASGALPIGIFHSRIAPNLFLPIGFETAPAVAPEVLTSALDAPLRHVVLLRPDGPAWAIPDEAFVDLASAILEGHAWAPLPTLSIEVSLASEALDLRVETLGLSPLAQIEDELTA